jgi:hypothetical protein
MNTISQSIPKGDRWLVPVTVTIPDDTDFDWSGILAKCEIRFANSSTLFATLTPSADLSVVGSATFVLELTGAQTIGLTIGDNLVGDLVVYRSSPVFGPHTLVTLALNVVRRITLTT